MKPLLLFILLGICWIPAQAAIEAYEFDSPQMEADYNQLINELRCLVCQNQNLSGSNAELAQELGVSVNTVKFHLRNLYDKLSVRNRAEAVARYISARRRRT